MRVKPKLSIVTVTYNQQDYIRETLDSFVIQRTDFAFEVIVSDDCSTDATPAILKEYAEKYSNIFKIFIKQENVGAQQNFVDALKLAQGKYIALCEGDDYWTDKNKLQIQVDFLEANSEYAMCFHPVKVVFEKSEEKDSIHPIDNNSDEFTLTNLLKGNFIQTNSVVYRRQNYNNIPTNILPLDWYLHLFHAQFGKIGFIDKVMSAYRRHEGGLWWDSYDNLSGIWDRYGVAHLKLHIGIYRMFGDNKSYAEIINKSIEQIMNCLASKDLKLGVQELKKVSGDFPNDLDLKNILTHFEHIEKINQHSNEQAKVIKHLSNQLDEEKRLREEALSRLEQTSQELEAIKSSVSWKIVRRLAHLKRLKI